MDQETLFTATKWDILKSLEKGDKSPNQLSAECSTSIANVSQQLRLLELAGLVSVRRIPNRDKGQPRVIYSLRADNSHIIACTPGFVEKKLLELSKTQKTVMKMWLSLDPSKQYFAERAFWNIEENLSGKDSLYYDAKNISAISLILVSEKEHSKKMFQEYQIEKDGVKMQVKFTLKKKEEFEEKNSLIKLY